MARKFTPAEDEYLRANHMTLARQEMAHAMGRSASSIGSRCFKLGLALPEETRLRCLRECHARAREQEANNRWSRFDARAATIWHLIDLKRAGFRARHGELSFDHEHRVLSRITSSSLDSYMSSPADLCASIA